MKERIGLIVLWVAAVGTVFTPGCATFRDGQVGSVEPWPPPAPPVRKSIAITVRMESVMEFGPGRNKMPVSDDELNQMRGKIWAEYQDSGLFSDVKTGLEDADLRADVQISHFADGSLGLVILSGLTLVMIPLKTNVDELTYTTTFKNRDGQVLGTIEKKEALNTWFQLFLIFVAPFKNIIGQVNAANTDLVRATIEQARAQNII